MLTTVSKSQFKARALEYCRMVEQQNITLVITDRGRPAVKLAPYVEETPETAFASLRGSVLSFQIPTEPVGTEDWDILE